MEETGAGASGCYPSPEEQPYSPLPSGEDAHSELHLPAASCKSAFGTTAMPGRYSNLPLSEMERGIDGGRHPQEASLSPSLHRLINSFNVIVLQETP